MCDNGVFVVLGVFGVFGRCQGVGWGAGLVSGGARPGMAGVGQAERAVGSCTTEGAVVQEHLRDNTKNPARSFNHRYLFR